MHVFNRRTAFVSLGALATSGCALDEKLRVSAASTTDVTSGAEQTQAISVEAEKLADFQRRYPDAMRPGDYVEKTQFRDVWAIRNRNRTLPRYLYNDMTWGVNFPAPNGFLTVKGGTKDDFRRIRAQLANDIDTSPWILIKGKTKPVAVVYSAWDCPYSRKMEMDMRRAGLSYYLIPSGLHESSNATARKIYGLPQFEKYWTELLTKSLITSPIIGKSKPYPEDAATDIAFLFIVPTGNGAPAPSTPLTILRNGVSMEGWNTEKFLPLVRKSTTYFS